MKHALVFITIFGLVFVVFPVAAKALAASCFSEDGYFVAICNEAGETPRDPEVRVAEAEPNTPCFSEDGYFVIFCSDASDTPPDPGVRIAENEPEFEVADQEPTSRACFSEEGYLIMFCNSGNTAPAPSPATQPPPEIASSGCFAEDGYFVAFCN